MHSLRAALLVALSLSIGWGVRGNFGHEYGAMLPGVLAAIAAVVMIGRPEWLPRVGYFAFFGALGWAFGGSISYMQVISYTHSGHLPSQVYGFGCLWLIGFLWATMGGLATAWPAEASRRRLTSLFRPLAWVFGGWLVLHFVLQWLAAWEASYIDIDDRTWQRQASLLYWMDSDWIEALAAGLALIAFDLWDRRFRPAGSLLLCAGGGALLGWLIQLALVTTGLAQRLLVWPLVQHQADPELLAQLAEQQGVTLAEIQADALSNWPNLFHLFPQHVGWIVGLAIGLTVYSVRFGKFRSGAGLLICMVAGWYLGFLLMPVLLGLGGAGLRMTPPRGDNWAGIVGVVAATLLWLARHGYRRVIFAGLLCGMIGGFGFAAAACVKLLLIAPGNASLTEDPAVLEAWQFWQRSNWHSFLEQSYGFINGLGIFAAMAWLRWRLPRLWRDGYQTVAGHWSHPLAIAFVMFGVIYLNMRKNVPVWVESGAVPATMRMPLVDSIELSAAAWFNLLFAALAWMGIACLRGHRRRPLAWMPPSWSGRGQLLYLGFLWVVMVMNFERALVGFAEGRLLTEGVIFINAVLVSWMISRWPRTTDVGPQHHRLATAATNRRWPRATGVGEPQRTEAASGVDRRLPWPWLAGLATLLLALCLVVMPLTVRSVYGDRFAGHAGLQKRFGPDALWKTTPIFKSKRHS